MSYGVGIYNENGNSILDSSDTPYIFTNKGTSFTSSIDFTASPYALVSIDWPTVSGNPTSSSIVGWNQHGESIVITHLGGNNYRAITVTGYSGGYPRGALSTRNKKIYIIDKSPPSKPTGFGFEVLDSSGETLLSSSEPLAKISSFGVINAGANTVIGGDATQQLLFAHAYYAYRRDGSLVGPWYDDSYYYTCFAVNDSNQYRVSRLRFDRINSNPAGNRLRSSPSMISYMLIDRPYEST